MNAVDASVQLLGRVSRTKPQPNVDGVVSDPARAGTYNEIYTLGLVPTKHLLADEGSYWVATNPTIGTGVAHALVTAFSDTSGLFVIKNNAPAGSVKRIYIDYLKLILTAAPATGVSLEFAVKIDNQNRLPTAGNVAITPVCVNMDEIGADVSMVMVQAFSGAALTVPASSASARVVSRTRIPTGINVVGDVYVVQFGGADYSVMAPPLTAIRATQPAALVAHAAPVVIGPQQFAVIHRWSLTETTTAPSYEYEIGGWIR